MSRHRLFSLGRGSAAALGFMALFTPSFAASAQQSEAGILARLKGKPLFLRGSWSDDDLAFDQAGTPLSAYRRTSFSEAGIDVTGVTLRHDVLEIRGQRVGLEFGKTGTPSRVPLRWKHYTGAVTLTIAGQAGEDFGPALETVFAPDLHSLIPSLPQYWAKRGDLLLAESGIKVAAEDSSATADTEFSGSGAASATSGPPVDHADKAVKPPRLLSYKEPAFTPAARGLQYSAAIQVYLWVEPSGNPAHLRILKPAGLGLDEAALAAVSKYRFAPATRDGVPVKVDLYVDVNFRIR